MFLDALSITVKRDSIEEKILHQAGLATTGNNNSKSCTCKKFYFKNFICNIAFSSRNKEINLKITYQTPNSLIPETIHAVNLEKEDTITFKIDLLDVREVHIIVATEKYFQKQESRHLYFFNHSLLEIVLDKGKRDLKKEFRPVLPLVLR